MPAQAAPTRTAAATRTPTPTRTTQAPQPTQPQAGGCHPLSNAGNCYKAGQYCRTSDHGVYGTDASGRAIKCVDNNGWRWEPA
ncbi:hypothetical protein GCM10023235_19600 [Kitasatospora terrestris]|uniref:Lipoprotein n=1 Tax=Kitasatospora terrestris TaxID=258051 RepID=A0ABP9DL89_9ACTN